MILNKDLLGIFKRYLIDEEPNPDERFYCVGKKSFSSREVYEKLEQGDSDLYKHMFGSFGRLLSYT